jgi:DNA-binding transcriptional MerR regulator
MKSLTIGHLARESGMNLETVRYYERRGLLPKPPRSASGYRLFPIEATQRLRFIQRAKELGFSLKRSGNCYRCECRQQQRVRGYGRRLRRRSPIFKQRLEAFSPWKKHSEN